jgi:hypothetical protein
MYSSALFHVINFVQFKTSHSEHTYRGGYVKSESGLYLNSAETIKSTTVVKRGVQS